MACNLPTHHEPSSILDKKLVAFPIPLALVGLVRANKRIILNIDLRIVNFTPISVLLKKNGPHIVPIYFTYIGSVHF